MRELRQQHDASRILDHSVLGPLPDVPDVTFTFDGIEVVAREGEPIASALLAAGFRVFRTMPQSAAPRGGYCMVGRCGDCLVEVDGVAGVQACTTLVRDGMMVQTQTGVGSNSPVEFMDGPL